jgi:hypothetical protein
MLGSFVSFINTKLNISGFPWSLAVCCLLLASLTFPSHLPLPAAMHLMFWFRFMGMKKSVGVSNPIFSFLLIVKFLNNQE